MMRSLWSGVSGLRNHQTRMDVVGNNISNVNTNGFKGGRANFQDMLSQTIQGASSGGGSRGGTNPMQVGLGVGIASIDTIFTDGSMQATGKDTDVAIQGAGFFTLAETTASGALNKFYTRAGAFDYDNNGYYLVPGTGLKVLGWNADADGQINPAGSSPAPVQITSDKLNMEAKKTGTMNFSSNLSASEPSVSQTSIDIYDSLGIAHKVTDTFFRVDESTWLCKMTFADPLDTATTPTTGEWQEIKFATDGKVSSVFSLTAPPTQAGGADVVPITALQLDSVSGSKHSKCVSVLDANDNPLSYRLDITNTGTNQWEYSVTQTGVSGATAIKGTIGLTGGTAVPYIFTPPLAFNGVAATVAGDVLPAAGAFLATSTPMTYTADTKLDPVVFQFAGGKSEAMSLQLNMNNVTQYGGKATVQIDGQDGYAAGVLERKAINQDGVIFGKYSNGQIKNLAQLALTNFNNPGGLEKIGSTMYAESSNSGVARTGIAGQNSTGKLLASNLEMSNVDLSNEFSNMIVTQRGFQANSKVITTTDQMLEELTNLKR